MCHFYYYNFLLILLTTYPIMTKQRKKCKVHVFYFFVIMGFNALICLKHFSIRLNITKCGEKMEGSEYFFNPLCMYSNVPEQHRQYIELNELPKKLATMCLP